MRFERLSNVGHPMYQKALKLYGASFPLHEQREPVSQEKILNDDEYFFGLIYDENVFVGLVLYWETNHFIYIEHFCIAPEMRNRKYGQRVLEQLGARAKTIILEIDPPVDAVSLRRKAFYQRSGFIENPYPHRHPPYHKEQIGHDLVIMSFPDKMTKTRYDTFQHYLEHHVMEGAFL